MISKILSFFSSPTYAQTPDEPPQLGELFASFDTIMGYIFPIAGLIAVAMLIYGGYMWIISGGDPSKKQVAQGTLTWSAIGLIFLFLIKAILTILVKFFVVGTVHY